MMFKIISIIYLASFWTANGEKCHVGERQSPIDIVSKDARYQEFRPFSVSGHHTLSLGLGTLYAKNTGNTLKLYAVSNHTTALLGSVLQNWTKKNY